jgi:hypothetical protein
VKCPLYFLAKGKTQMVEDCQIGDVEDHWRSHPVSGWMTSEAFSVIFSRFTSMRPAIV